MDDQSTRWPPATRVVLPSFTDFAPPQRVNGLSFTVGELPEFTVNDGRVVSHPGWDLLASIADYRNEADASIVIPSQNAGLGERAGSARYPTVLTGQVSLLSPPDRPAGTYHSTMTLTLVSR